jgi:methylated-DNA-[protein]-cysteine S-methyltransferase
MNEKLSLKYLTFHTPLGWLLVAESPDGIALVDFLGPDCPSEDALMSTVLGEYPDATPSPGACTGLLGKTKTYILAYLQDRTPPPKIPLDLRKGTPFDRSVWKEIEAIAFGESRSYSQIAAKAQSARASRAVGRACGRNPVPILIPCHRVIGSGGKLGGYSGGLPIKRALLDLEGISYR